MKTIYTFLSFLIFQSLTAQINLIGISNSGGQNLQIARWQALDSAVTYIPTGMDAYLLSSSVFDAYHSDYFFSGIADTASGLFSYNTQSGEQTLRPFSAFTNVTEIDMSTGKIYNLKVNEVGQISINQYDIKSGTDSLIGMVNEPGLLGLVVDAVTFDANQGILYYAGVDGESIPTLFGFQVRSTPFTYTKQQLYTNNVAYNMTCLNFDNVNNRLFALGAAFDSLFNYTGSSIIELEINTGQVSVLMPLFDYPYYLAGSSSFDQLSSTMLLVAFDNAFNERMLAVNTLDSTLTAGFMPEGVSEIVCDNSEFSRQAYQTTSSAYITMESPMLYPVPASGILYFRLPGLKNHEVMSYSLFNLNGVEISKGFINNKVKGIDISGVEPGVYMLRLQHTDGSVFPASKFVKL